LITFVPGDDGLELPDLICTNETGYCCSSNEFFNTGFELEGL